MREGEGGRRREGRQREQGGEQGCFDHKTFGCMKLLCISLVPKLLPMQLLLHIYCDKSWGGAWEQVQLYTVLTEDIYTKKKELTWITTVFCASSNTVLWSLTTMNVVLKSDFIENNLTPNRMTDQRIS